MSDIIRTHFLNVIFLQEVNVEFLILSPGFKFFMNPGYNGRGTGIIYRSFLKIDRLNLSSCSRILSAIIDHASFVNIYSPSGSQNANKRVIFFETSLSEHLDFSKPLILVGDFNCVIKQKDSKNNTQICKQLYNVVKDLNLRMCGNTFTKIMLNTHM